MKIAIIQPYFFPYIAYFQIINAVDKFVFYDDVNFINRGWINRNRIIINNSVNYFTVQLKGASQNKLINQIEINENRNKLAKTIQRAYKKAPFYFQVWPAIEQCLEYETSSISELAIFSIRSVCKYLDLKTNFDISSKVYQDTKGLEKAARLKSICKHNDATVYVNPIGGQELYNKADFKKENIDLYFLKTNFQEYKQFNDEFIPGLSILDVLMFNSVEEVHKMLDNYELI